MASNYTGLPLSHSEHHGLFLCKQVKANIVIYRQCTYKYKQFSLLKRPVSYNISGISSQAYFTIISNSISHSLAGRSLKPACQCSEIHFLFFFFLLRHPVLPPLLLKPTSPHKNYLRDQSQLFLADFIKDISEEVLQGAAVETLQTTVTCESTLVSGCVITQLTMTLDE